MRVTSYRKQLWILALLALSCISALAHAPANVVQAQSAVHRVTSPSPPQHRIVNFVAVGQPSTPSLRMQIEGQLKAKPRCRRPASCPTRAVCCPLPDLWDSVSSSAGSFAAP